MEIWIDLKKSAAENANDYYGRAKKAKSKVRGAKIALENTNKKIADLENKRDKFTGIESTALKKKVVKKKRWFEKFRWFYTTDNFLVVCGKDATTNEILIKKYTNDGDIIFHAQVQGSPFVVVKNEANIDIEKIPEQTKNEAAQAAASYSKAWGAGSGSVNVYSVLPGQVSKSAKSGEYLEKGAFMVEGKKDWYRNTEVELAVGVMILKQQEEQDTEIIGGPFSAVKSHSDYAVRIETGDKRSSELAQDIKKIFMEICKDSEREFIKKINISDIQVWIPSGKGRIKR